MKLVIRGVNRLRHSKCGGVVTVRRKENRKIYKCGRCWTKREVYKRKIK